MLLERLFKDGYRALKLPGLFFWPPSRKIGLLREPKM